MEKEKETVSGLDPWGLRKIERLLTELEGVGSLKIVPDGHGGIDEVHVLSASDLTPKQIVRNIESALLAEFGMQIDHRKISVAQTRAPEISPAQAIQAQRLLEAQEAAYQAVAPVAATPPMRTVLKDIHMERLAGREFSCRVEVIRDGETYVGEAEGPDFERSRMEVAAAACLEALLQSGNPDIYLSLQGVSLMQSLDRTFVVIAVGAGIGRRAQSLSGIATVDDSVEEAAVLAGMMATNRWLEGR